MRNASNRGLNRIVISLTILPCLFLTACESFFFYPSPALAGNPSDIGLRYEEVWFQSAGESPLNGWYLPAKGRPKAAILHLHGNAENMSTHLGSVYWLPARGFSVLLLDYRGYGKSAGRPSLSGIQDDAKRALEWLSKRCPESPLLIFGQSLGGAAAIPIAADPKFRERLSGLIVDSAFSSYRRITKEKLSAFWATWPLQWLGPLTVSDALAPIRWIDQARSLPVLFISYKEDPIVYPHHSEMLFQAANEPKKLWLLDGLGHTSAFRTEEERKTFVSYLERTIASEPFCERF